MTRPIQWERLLTLLMAGGTLSFLTVVGNCFVLVAILRYRRLRHLPRNFFIYVVSLAIADLVVGGFVQPLALINDLRAFGGWPFGEALCHVWRATDVLASTASILHLVFIGLERFRATSGRVLRLRGVSKRGALTNILIAWTLSALISFPAILWWRHHDAIKAQTRRSLHAYDSSAVSENEAFQQAAENSSDDAIFGDEPGLKICQFTDEVGYILLSSAVSFYLPAVIIVVLYIRIFQRTTRLVRSLRNGTLFVKIPDSFGNIAAQVDESSRSTTPGAVAENNISLIMSPPVTTLSPFTSFTRTRCSIVPVRVHRGRSSAVTQPDPTSISRLSSTDVKQRPSIGSPRRPASSTELTPTIAAGRCSSESRRLNGSPRQLLLANGSGASGELQPRDRLHLNLVRLSSSLASMSLKHEDSNAHSAAAMHEAAENSFSKERISSLKQTRSFGNLELGNMYPFTYKRPSLPNEKGVVSNDRLHSSSVSKSSLDIRCASELEHVSEAQLHITRKCSNDSSPHYSVAPSAGIIAAAARATASAREALRQSLSGGATPSRLVVPMTPMGSIPIRRSMTMGSQQQRRRANGLLNEQRAVQTLCLVVVTFLICWTPFFIVNGGYLSLSIITFGIFSVLQIYTVYPYYALRFMLFTLDCAVVLSALWPGVLKGNDSLLIAITYLGYLNRCV